MADQNFQQILFQELLSFLEPLISTEGDTDRIFDLLSSSGWDVRENLGGSADDLADTINTVVVSIQTIKDFIEHPAEDLSQLEKAFKNSAGVLAALNDLPSIAANAGLSIDPSDLAQDLLNTLAVSYLDRKLPFLYHLLELLTILRDLPNESVIQDGLLLREKNRMPQLKLRRLGPFISDPIAMFREEYWPDGFVDQPTVNRVAHRLFPRVTRLLSSVGGNDFRVGGGRLYALVGRGSGPAELSEEEEIKLDGMVSFGWEVCNAEEFEETEVGATLGILAENEGGPGVFVMPHGRFDVSSTAGDWIINVSSGVEVQGFEITPSGLSLYEEGDNAVNIGFSVQSFNSGQSTIMLGSANGTHLKIGSVFLSGDFTYISNNPELTIMGGVENVELLISPGDGDGFLQSIIPGDGVKVEFDLLLGWSTLNGFHIEGSGGLEILLPAHIDLGPISFEDTRISLEPRGDVFPLTAGGTIKGNLGPLTLVVEDIGFKLELTFPANGGNLGPINLAPGFKPPNGVGLSIDAEVIKGGGYLFFDFDKEEYAGVLELDLNGIVSVKAIGLITTKMPDGKPGFSLLMIITAEFGSPIQLGLGFTLSGVGGLLGLNRTMRLEVIATGIRDGGINSIMFPQNVIANAPRIISDLKKYFPVEEGTFLIGPMVKIGWGTPNLVTVSLGVIIEIDTNTSSVGGMAILGVLKVALPDEEHPEILIQVNFMGAIEPDKKRLWFFASIYDSRVLFITLEGQMGLLVGWGNDPSFLVSVGGFHPAFNPPALPFGAINRIAISILNESYARIRVEGYFAVTSNSVQFGAAVELFFGLSEFKIDGHLAFDALFRFSPFYFVISISASLSVKVFGVGLFSVRFRGSLEGPTPWYVEGTGSISILFFHIDVDFSYTWGTHEDTVLPPISVMPLLVAEYKKLENWQAVLPANNQLLVSLRSFDQGSIDLILHPVGSLKISQRTVPLGVTIDKVGNQKPSDANHFDITVNTPGLVEKSVVNESQAVGQFFVKSDGELLSAKSFEPMKGGIELSVVGEQYRSPEAVKRVVRHEQIIIDTNYKRFVRPIYTLFGSLFGLFLKGNAASQSVLSKKRQDQLKPFADMVNVGNVLYSVASNEDNSPFSEDAVGFTSQMQAQEYMNQQVAVDANLANQLHVIPETELQRAA